MFFDSEPEFSSPTGKLKSVGTKKKQIFILLYLFEFTLCLLGC